MTRRMSCLFAKYNIILHYMQNTAEFVLKDILKQMSQVGLDIKTNNFYSGTFLA